MVSLGLPFWGHPLTYWCNPGEPMEKASPVTPYIHSPVFLHNSTRQSPTTPELHKMCLRFEVDNNEIIKG